MPTLQELLYSLFPVPYSLFPIPCFLYLTQLKTAIQELKPFELH
ncbi:hypothetical protein [Moorena producens]